MSRNGRGLKLEISKPDRISQKSGSRWKSEATSLSNKEYVLRVCAATPLSLTNA